MGEAGLRQAAALCTSRAHYFAQRLEEVLGWKRVYSGEFFHEFVTDLPKQDEILAALEQADILGGLPLEGGILWCATEKVSRRELDEAVSIVKEVLDR